MKVWSSDMKDFLVEHRLSHAVDYTTRGSIQCEFSGHKPHCAIENNEDLSRTMSELEVVFSCSSFLFPSNILIPIIFMKLLSSVSLYCFTLSVISLMACTILESVKVAEAVSRHSSNR